MSGTHWTVPGPIRTVLVGLRWAESGPGCIVLGCTALGWLARVRPINGWDGLAGWRHLGRAVVLAVSWPTSAWVATTIGTARAAEGRGRSGRPRDISRWRASGKAERGRNRPGSEKEKGKGLGINFKGEFEFDFWLGSNQMEFPELWVRGRISRFGNMVWIWIRTWDGKNFKNGFEVERYPIQTTTQNASKPKTEHERINLR